MHEHPLIAYAEILDYPFMVSIQEIQLLERHICAGIILTTTWVLTASHCLLHQGPEEFSKDELLREPSYYEVVAGTEDFSYGQKSPCKIFLIHYNASTDPNYFHQGIALIGLKTHLTPTLQIKSIRNAPARRKFRSTIFGAHCDIIGWSKTRIKDIKNYQLIKVHVKVLSKKDCLELQEQANIMTSDQYICLETNGEIPWLDVSAALICGKINAVEAIIVSKFDFDEGPTTYLGLRLDYSALWIATRITKDATILHPQDLAWC